jgi:phosphoglycolate phosphatase
LPRPDHHAVRRVIGLSLVGAVAQLLPDQLASRAAELAEAYKEAFRALHAKGDIEEPLYPEIGSTVRALAAREDVLLAIATGKSRRGVDRVLMREGLESCFVSIQTADDHPSKPDPSMILQALAETGADRDAALMIGDTSYDMEMARLAGVGAVGVGWGYHDAHELLEAGAQSVVGASTALLPALDALLQRAGAAT